MEFPEDARRGAVEQFCALYGVSVASFYRIRAIAAQQGPEAAAAALSTAPENRPARISRQIEDKALSIRADLDANGWDAGPLSVAAEMRRQGLTPPIKGLAGQGVRPSWHGQTGAGETASCRLPTVPLPAAERLLATSVVSH